MPFPQATFKVISKPVTGWCSPHTTYYLYAIESQVSQTDHLHQLDTSTDLPSNSSKMASRHSRELYASRGCGCTATEDHSDTREYQRAVTYKMLPCGFIAAVCLYTYNTKLREKETISVHSTVQITHCTPLIKQAMS